MLEILVDADGCPVKQEVYRVARRYGLTVTVVANSQMHIPDEDWLKLVVVSDRLDAADDWIVEYITKNDIVVSGDIPLASRCLKKGAKVVGLKGRLFTVDSIGDVLATRDLMSHLRNSGMITGGPAPFEKRDRSRFLQSLDGIIQDIRNGK
ncbi:MAG: YaiI/YqxD family protein [Chloroflexi bacterium]|nr:YaiI/YqxD family protein [Chloroflexota bacterium]